MCELANVSCLKTRFPTKNLRRLLKNPIRGNALKIFPTTGHKMTIFWDGDHENGVPIEKFTHFSETPFSKRGFFSRLLK
jgi:hypothetical protein